MNLEVTPEDEKVISEIMDECRNVMISKIKDGMSTDMKNRILVAACCAWIELARTGFILALGEDGFRRMIEGIANQMGGAMLIEDLDEDPTPPNTSLH